MPRDKFRRADINVALLDDPKFKRLWRVVRDQVVMNEAVVLYLATVLESWSNGERVSVDDAEPIWMVPSPGTVDHLKAVGLLDDDGRIPEATWRSWFGPAVERVAKRKDASAAANAARWGSDRNATALPTESVSSPPSQAKPSNTKPSNTPPPNQGLRMNGTNPRAMGTNPRSTGTSPRAIREEQKRGPSALGDILLAAAKAAEETTNGETTADTKGISDDDGARRTRQEGGAETTE